MVSYVYNPSERNNFVNLISPDERGKNAIEMAQSIISDKQIVEAGELHLLSGYTLNNFHTAKTGLLFYPMHRIRYFYFNIGE